MGWVLGETHTWFGVYVAVGRIGIEIKAFKSPL
jgi:hypothetical protein